VPSAAIEGSPVFHFYGRAPVADSVGRHPGEMEFARRLADEIAFMVDGPANYASAIIHARHCNVWLVAIQNSVVQEPRVLCMGVPYRLTAL
jgi:hypothetical protein